MIQTIFAIEPSPHWPDHLERMAERGRSEPFEPAVLELVGALSKRLLTAPETRPFPELAALAHWFRPASVARMKQDHFASAAAYALRPRGQVFIIAPANVDVLFIYGWLLSLLGGNVTVVRVSQKPSAARDAFLTVLRQLAAEPRFADVLKSSAVVSYPHDGDSTRLLSAWCDARLIWGGDATVNTIRAVPLKPTAVEGAFADRFSLAAFDATALLRLEDGAIAELARRFANDTLWFGQQACSSPRVLFWTGSEQDVDAAKARFWPPYREAAARFEDEPAAMISRLSDVFTMAASGLVDRIDWPLGQLPVRAHAAVPSEQVRELHSGFGLFIEYRIDRLAAVADFLIDKDQTLVVEGHSEQDVAALVERLPNRSLDRIVRIGQATDFSVDWDGMNLLDLLTRRVSVPRAAVRA